MSEIQNHLHNLDDGIIEHFDFVILGHKYRFRQPNTEELDQLRVLREAEDKLDETRSYFYQFITPVDTAPAFEEIAKKLTVPHWKRFNAMVEAEMGIDGDNQS